MRFAMKMPRDEHTVFTEEAAAGCVGQRMPLMCGGEEVGRGEIVHAEIVDSDLWLHVEASDESLQLGPISCRPTLPLGNIRLDGRVA